MAENSETQNSSVSDPSPPKPSNSDDSLKYPQCECTIYDASPSHIDVDAMSQIPPFPYFPPFQHGDINMLPIVYPALVPGIISAQNPEQMNRGPGIYAVPALPCMGTVTGIPANTLIPLTYSTPTRSSTSEAGAGGEQSQVGQQQQPPAQQLGPQRPVVARRLQIAFHLDLVLIFKLAAVIFIFNQDGSRQRLAVFVFFASIVYLYQTGALTPLMRWVSQAMHRAAAPPRPPGPAARVDPIVRQGNENENAIAAAPDGQLGAENDNPPGEDADQVAENEAAPEAGVEGGNHWWGIVKEIQMIVFGFITSLLPGFHNMDHA